MTQAVPTRGSPATIHPSTPAPAKAISVISARLSPPSPWRIDSTKTALVSTA